MGRFPKVCTRATPNTGLGPLGSDLTFTRVVGQLGTSDRHLGPTVTVGTVYSRQRCPTFPTTDCPTGWDNTPGQAVVL
eukprot:6859017-Prymnesium_polylepis.1